MSTEFTLVCDSRCEYVDPHVIDGQLGKFGQIIAMGSRFGAITLYLIYDRWEGRRVRLVPDWDPPSNYCDVGLKVINDFNDSYGCDPILARVGYGADADDEHIVDAAQREEDVRLVYDVKVLAGSYVVVRPVRAVVRHDKSFVDVPLDQVEDFEVVDVRREEGFLGVDVYAQTNYGEMRSVQPGRVTAMTLIGFEVRCGNRTDQEISCSFEFRGTARVHQDKQNRSTDMTK